MPPPPRETPRATSASASCWVAAASFAEACALSAEKFASGWNSKPQASAGWGGTAPGFSAVRVGPPDPDRLSTAASGGLVRSFQEQSPASAIAMAHQGNGLAFAHYSEINLIDAQTGHPLPVNDGFGKNPLFLNFLVVVAFASCIIRHINYYKHTKKIY